MGGGRQIALGCDCGFETNCVLVGRLLPQESLEQGYSIIVATFDLPSQRLQEHALVLSAELQASWELSGPGSGELDEDVDDYFARLCQQLRMKHGHLFSIHSEAGPTQLRCPACGTGQLVLRALGNWIA